jgi:arylsulfatase A-like enzyme
MDRPNIVFFFTDDQRFSTIQALGQEPVKTPNIDKLVERGTTFTHAHIPGGTSGAVCLPSRAMLHTGRTLFHLEDCGQSIPDDHTLLGEHLRDAGYTTFGTGKWHNGASSFHRSFSDGAEIFHGGMADHWNVPAFDYDPTGKYDAELRWCVNAFTSNELRHEPGDHVNSGLHSSEMVCGAAIDFIDRHDGDTPFFAYVSFLAPHDPRTMPQEYLDMYDPDEIELPPNFMGGHPFNNGALHIRDEELAAFPRSPEETRRHIAEYYGMISHLDAQLGRVVTALEEKGILDNTIIVFAGDNGLAVGQHGLFGKQSLYEHSVRVPLILAGPGVPSNEKRDAFVYLLDIYPTLCDLLDLDIPESVDGESFKPIMDDASTCGREQLYLAYTELHRGVRTRTHKLIEYVVDGSDRVTQLFDLENDPWELKNLAADPGSAGTVTKLRHDLRHWAAIWDDCETHWGQTFWAGFGEE